MHNLYKLSSETKSDKNILEIMKYAINYFIELLGIEVDSLPRNRNYRGSKFIKLLDIEA